MVEKASAISDYLLVVRGIALDWRIFLYTMSPSHYPYLISRWLDPVVAVSIGVAAYVLHEQREHRQTTLYAHLSKYFSV